MPWPRSPPVTWTSHSVPTPPVWPTHAVWPDHNICLNYIVSHLKNSIFDITILKSIINVYISTHLNKTCGMIFVQFNENVENETTGHELWPGFCSNQFKSSKCDLASKIILFIQKMSKPKIGDLGNGVCVHMIPIGHLYFPTMTINCLLFGKHIKSRKKHCLNFKQCF